MSGKKKYQGNNYIDSYLKYSKNLQKFLNKYTGNSHLSEDISQETFLKLYEKKIFLNPQCRRTRNYIFTIAKNMAVDRSRKRFIEEEKLKKIIKEKTATKSDYYADISDSFFKNEIMLKINDCINSFPDEEKNLIMERFYKSKRVSEISKEKKISSYLIKKMEKKACKKIKTRLPEIDPPEWLIS